jgi:hypothetical protein
MAFSIGVRLYRISIVDLASRETVVNAPGADPCDLFAFLEGFIARHEANTVEEEASRSWMFKPIPTQMERTLHGHISYGTHGFESTLVDVVTGEPQYDRKSTDVEAIPLYFQCWSPQDRDFALMAFQSFQGRSCVGLVRSTMMREFSDMYPNASLRFLTLGASEMLSDDLDVKSVTLVRPRQTSDMADAYQGMSEEIDYKLQLSARRRGGVLAKLGLLRNRLTPDEHGFIQFDGQAFENVAVDAKVGGRRRTIALFGRGGDPGLIDITEDVTFDATGHPTLESVQEQVDELMDDFAARLVA